MEHLALQRATADPTQAHPNPRFSLLSWAPDADHDTALILLKSADELATRHLLPDDRVWAATRSARSESLGGFHHPDRGYRHERMGALITRYGLSSRRRSARSRSATTSSKIGLPTRAISPPRSGSQGVGRRLPSSVTIAGSLATAWR
jgi:hypothetical protein